MTPAWMLATALVTLLLAASALVLSRVVALYRGTPLRWVWTLATVASLAVSALWLRPAALRPVQRESDDVQPSALETAARSRAGNAEKTPLAAHTSATTAALSNDRRMSMESLRIRLPAASPAIGATLRLVWWSMSLGLAVILAFAAMRLREERARWREDDVSGVSVLIAPAFGPALVGVAHPRIVLPEWVLTLDAAAQRAIVTHEAEHRDARDPALMLVGLLAVVIMPWNPGLWLSWRGLRRAIELDCDERVVRRGIEGGEYARVLLHAWKTARGSWLASTAFAERATGLGARVEHLMRPEPREKAMRTILGSALAAGFVFLACATPAPQMGSNNTAAPGPYPLVIVDGVRRPDLPPLFRFTGAVTVDTTTAPTYRITYNGPRMVDTAAQKLYPSMDDGTMMQTIDAPASITHFGDAAKYGAVLYYTPKYRAAGGPIIAPGEGNMSVRAADPATSATEMAERGYANLFNGISLPADRRATALRIIESDFAWQRSLKGPGLAIFPLRIAAITERNAQLRALLITDADRARFDQRSKESRPCCTPTIEDVVTSEYRNIFGYPDEGREVTAHRPALAADGQGQARAIIRTHINDELALYARAPGAWTDSYDQRVAMRSKRDADLRALLSTDADREKFDKMAARLRETALKRD